MIAHTELSSPSFLHILKPIDLRSFSLLCSHLNFGCLIFIVLGHLDKLLRPLVIGRLGRFGDESIIAEAQKRFEVHVSGKALIPADLRSPVYRTVLSVGDESTYNTMLKVSYCQKLVFDYF
jgi:hypothetical protein